MGNNCFCAGAAGGPGRLAPKFTGAAMNKERLIWILLYAWAILTLGAGLYAGWLITQAWRW